MVIGIIGASLSGLVAGKKLALAGHDVTVIEENSIPGYRLATKRAENGFFDYGIPFLSAQSEIFQSFIDELIENDVLYKWADHFELYDGTQLHSDNPNHPKNNYYAGSDGVNEIAEYLVRWMEIKKSARVGGLTHIGADRTKKRSWMINLTNINVFECDAVIIATDGINANGILQTTQDETSVRRLGRYIDEIDYLPRYSLMASYKEEPQTWQGIKCTDSNLLWIGNDSSKSKNQSNSNITIQSSSSFALAHTGEDAEIISQKLLNEASEIANLKSDPQEAELYYWKYFEAANTIADYFMELETDEAPLAIVGDYFGGTSVEAAYLSGHYLAEYWIHKYETVTA